MAVSTNLSYAAAAILAAIDAGYGYGLSVIEMTGLPSGTVYPALRRLEAAKYLSSQWENERLALKEQRPSRKYYTVTAKGRELLKVTLERYPLLRKIETAPAGGGPDDHCCWSCLGDR